MNRRLARLWQRVALYCALPMTGLLTIAFVLTWFTASQLTNFDKQLLLGGFVFNSIQLVLLFVIAAAQANTHESVTKTVADLHSDHRRLHDRIADLANANTVSTELLTLATKFSHDQSNARARSKTVWAYLADLGRGADAKQYQSAGFDIFAGA